jgi:hypothetical protein
LIRSRRTAADARASAASDPSVPGAAADAEEAADLARRTSASCSLPAPRGGAAGGENEGVSIPRDRELIAQIRSIRKTAADAGYSRYDTEGDDAETHADRYWALALAAHAAGVVRGRKRRRPVVRASIV